MAKGRGVHISEITLVCIKRNCVLQLRVFYKIQQHLFSALYFDSQFVDSCTLSVHILLCHIAVSIHRLIQLGTASIISGNPPQWTFQSCRYRSTTPVQEVQIIFSYFSYPSPPIDNIWVMVIVWRLRGNIIRTALCWIVWHTTAHLREQFLQVQQIGFVTLGPLRCA